jgi:prophage regulatory protein
MATKRADIFMEAVHAAIAESTPAAIYRRRQVEDLTGLPRSVIYERMAKGTFPKQINLGGRSVGWLRSDVHRWVEDRRAESFSSQVPQSGAPLSANQVNASTTRSKQRVDRSAFHRRHLDFGVVNSETVPELDAEAQEPCARTTCAEPPDEKH